LIPTTSEDTVAHNTQTPPPLVHAIVLTHRGAAFLAEGLRALLAEAERSRDLCRLHPCVVDNGSQDGTQRLLARDFPAVERLRLEENLGYGKANNLALRRALAAGAEFALLLNDDVEVEPGFLRALLASAAAQPQAGLFTGTLLLRGEETVNSTGLVLDAFGRATDRDLGLTRSALARPEGEVEGVSGGALLLRCASLERLGLFDPGYFAYYEDVDLSLRARALGIACWYCPAAIARHRFSATFGKGSPLQRYLLGKNHLRTLARHQPPLKAALLVPATAAFRVGFKAPLELLRGRPGLALAELHAGVEGLFAAVRALPQRLAGGIPEGAEPSLPPLARGRRTS
jgi:GT2 family glycosyltransferase